VIDLLKRGFMILRKRLDKFILCLLFFLICLPAPVRAMEMRRAALIGLSALVAAGGMAYWLYPRVWSSRGTNQSSNMEELADPVKVGNSFCEGREVSLGNGVSVTQIKVPDQEGATCGYHSVLNSINLFALETGDENWGVQLCNHKLIQEFFGEFGEWRNAIVRDRVRMAYYDYIWNLFINCLRPDEQITDEGYNKDKIKETYKSLLKDYCSLLVDNIFKGEKVEIRCGAFYNHLQSVNISFGDVNQYVRIIGFPRDQIERHIRTEFFKYFNETKLPRSFIDLSFYRMACNDYQERYKQRLDLEGGWIDEVEIGKLVQKERPALGSDMFTIIPSADDLVNPNIDGGFVPERNRCQYVREQLQNPAVRDYIHCFILGTMKRMINENQSTEKGTIGHWFAVLVHKLQKQRKYIVADSLNQPCLNQDPFKQLITVLEGQEIVPLLQQAVKDRLPYLEEKLQAIRERNCTQDELHNLLDFNHFYQMYGGTYEALGGKEQFLAQFDTLLKKET
jgi:hypothetical protein